ncbi:MAG: hypothetical protein ACTSVZ_06320 [Promethearchaeota archaeon]
MSKSRTSNLDGNYMCKHMTEMQGETSNLRNGRDQAVLSGTVTNDFGRMPASVEVKHMASINHGRTAR